MFHRAPYRLQLRSLQSSLDVCGHPETTSNPKNGFSLGKVASVCTVYCAEAYLRCNAPFRGRYISYWEDSVLMEPMTCRNV